MAQTKKRRRSKHRGNAAGVVEIRGRTGRRPSPQERKRSDKEQARERRMERLHRKPTWRGAINRSLIAAALLALLFIFVMGQPVVRALPLAAAMLAIYIPLGYFTDLWLWRRRERKKLAAGGRA
ncbi:MAG TPA: hypothetical protein VGV36_02820 [Solirubrobacteraceae bacterium]|nr:hypothetical protein [Solirubrobacteraceae bacterium]